MWYFEVLKLIDDFSLCIHQVSSIIKLSVYSMSSHINTPPFMSAAVGSIRQPTLGVWGSHQVGLALQQVLVLWIVSQPVEQGLAGIIAHTSVGQAHCQSHEGWEVVWVELQTPG